MQPKFPIVTCLVALACIALACQSQTINNLLAFDREAIFSGQLWRLWSAHIVHFSVRHALIDTAVFLMIGAAVEHKGGSLWFGISVLIAAPVISLGLLLGAPDLLYYRGASGIAMMVTVLACTLIWSRGKAHKIAVIFLAVFIAEKMRCDALGHSMTGSNLPPDIVVAWQAHFLGVACGLAFAAKQLRINVADATRLHCAASRSLMRRSAGYLGKLIRNT